jgi:sugar/nucleoside kinase (ribokinase family)
MDRTPKGSIPGGTAIFASRVAKALGCRVAVVTSSAADLDHESLFPGIQFKNVPAPVSTVFENTYHEGGRQQRVHSVAHPIESKHIPKSWRRASIVHLAPIADEIDPGVIELFTNGLVGLTPQGWFRSWDDEGVVFAKSWQQAEESLPLAASVIMSLEDLADPNELTIFRERARILVLTEREAGCRVYCRGEERQFRAPAVHEVNPTGAGDIFAAAFFIRLHQTRGNPWAAAEFANRVAAASVAQETLDDKISAISELVSGEKETRFND